jgi:type IV pilus assembly protein PilF
MTSARKTDPARSSFALAWAAIALAIAVSSGCSTTTTTTQPTLVSPPDTTRGQSAAPEQADANRRTSVRLELASAYFGRGQVTTALEEVKKAIAADPNNGPAFNLRGLIYASLGDDAQAQDSFRRALQINPRDADAMQNFGWYFCQQKRFPEADEMFRRALAIPQYRDSPRTLLTQGICQARAGQWAEAEATLSRSYELDPSNPATAVNLTEVLYRRNELERARFYIRRINSNRDISNAQTLWLALRIEHKLGNDRSADDLGTQLRNRFPESREAAAFEGGRFNE